MYIYINTHIYTHISIEEGSRVLSRSFETARRSPAAASCECYLPANPRELVSTLWKDHTKDGVRIMLGALLKFHVLRAFQTLTAAHLLLQRALLNRR